MGACRSDDSGNRDELSEVLGYTFRDGDLLAQALTHSSYRYETTRSVRGSNEVLEFLGDAVVNLVTAALLIDRFPDKQEGDLSKMRAELVNERSLAEVARQIGLEDRLLIGKSARIPGKEIPASILADGIEALIGAVFKDGGFEAASRIVASFITPLLDAKTLEAGTDYKTRLQEYTQKAYKTLPEYHLEATDGPEHRKVFKSSVWVRGERVGEGHGRSIKASEQEAARQALAALQSGGAGEK